MNNNELHHFGVMGMRWGRRRRQESGGSQEIDSVRFRNKKTGEVVKTHSLRVKGKDQSQDEFDREVATGILKNKNSSKEERKLAKEILSKQKNSKYEIKAAEQRQKAKEVVDTWVNEQKALNAVHNKPFDEAKARKVAERDARLILGLDVNASVKSVKKERIAKAAIITTAALLAAGNIALRVYERKQQNQLAAQLLDNLFTPAKKVINI